MDMQILKFIIFVVYTFVCAQCAVCAFEGRLLFCCELNSFSLKDFFFYFCFLSFKRPTTTITRDGNLKQKIRCEVY